MTPEDFMAGATVEPLGTDWGVPIWRFTLDDRSVETHGKTEDVARAAALEVLLSEERLGKHTAKKAATT